MAGRNKFETREAEEALIKLKMEIITELKKYIHRAKWDQKQAAYNMRTSRSCVHLVESLKVEKLSVGQLFTYLARLEPKFRILIATR